MQEIITPLNKYIQIMNACQDKEQLENNLEASDLLIEAYKHMREDDMPLKIFCIVLNNYRKREELFELLKDDLIVGKIYSNKHIKQLLAEYYERLEIRHPREGSILKPTIEDFTEYNFFLTAECTLVGRDGKLQQGLKIIGHSE